MTIKKITAGILLCFVCFLATAQENLPADYLSADFHKGRRQALRELMPANSVTVIFAFPERLFSNDVNYRYHPNPDLYYFSGYKEPDAVLLIFKEQQQAGNNRYDELIFVRKRNAAQEQWTGRRLGVEGVRNQLGFSHVYNSDEFKSFPIDFSKFSQVFHDDIAPADGSNTAALINSFCDKAGIRRVFSKELESELQRLVNTTPADLPRRVRAIEAKMVDTRDEAYRSNELLAELLANPDSLTLVKIAAKVRSSPSPTVQYRSMTGTLREIKTPEELVVLGKSVKLSALAHTEVMRAIQPGMSETELEGIHLYMHKKLGAEDEGYPPIVGAGANGCILHYIENNNTRVDNQLVLMDVGSEYHGYSADVTRTLPANGKFTPEQRAIYQLVYDAQEAIFPLCKEGVPFADLNRKATEVLAAGLLKLGIIKEAAEVRQYYPHGCSHHLGLDVHDRSSSPILKENMVITVEPGIYIPNNSPCDPKWWNIAVRLEDDVVIGKDKCVNLSADAPRKADEVEKKIAEKSVFSNFTVPGL